MKIVCFAAASFVGAIFLAFAVHAEAAPGPTSIAEENAQRARVVLIGGAAKSDELRSVLSELLDRQGIRVEYEERARFSPKALLSESPDPRVWVFVSEPGPRMAKLYFRGPYGKRFLLRQLALKNGLDELGRELIAQVVETSTVALLRSDAGVSREEARAGMSDDEDTDGSSDDAAASSGDATPTVDDAADSASKARPPRFEYDLDARGFLKWTGHDLGLDHGIGLETAVSYRLGQSAFVRGRAVFEYGFGQSIETGALDATIGATAFRAGLDVGTMAGVSAWSLGVLGGADFRKISPKASADPTLALAAKSSATVPVLRVEARYELALGAFRVTGGAFADASLSDTHYDVRDANGQHAVATPWRVCPGAALTLGFRKSW